MEVLFPPFRLDLVGERLWRDEREIPLRPKTFAVLRYLAECAGRPVSTAELLKAVWGDVAVSDVMPRLCIRELRVALGDESRTPRYIETRPGRGYEFVAPVRAFADSKPLSRDGSPDPFNAPAGLPLVGRAADLAQLRAMLDRARSGERQTVFISGEPGIGKSRLVEEFLADQRAPDLWVAKGECVEQYGAGEAYLPILTALERVCRSAGPERVLPPLRQTAPAWLSQMSSLIEPSEHEALMLRLAGPTRQRMLRELASLLETLASERVLVVWLEDLHWADHSTLEAIGFLARRSETARLLLLGSYRPTELPVPDPPLTRLAHELVLHGHAREMALQRLPEAAIAEYLAIRLGGTPVSTGLARHIHRRTDGNPLFMVTVTDDLVGRMLVVRRGGQWSLDDTRPESVEHVPASLRHLVQQQAQRLAPEDRQLLEVASVAGLEFSAAVVAAGLGEDDLAVEGKCMRLAKLGPFLESRGQIDWLDGTTAAAFGFHHAVIRDVFYEGIPAGYRRQLHGRIAERLERAFAGRVRDSAAELAMHFERARDTRRAVQYHGAAGKIALERAAHAEAIVYLTRALDALENIPESVQRSRLELSLRVALGWAQIFTRGYGAAEVERSYSRALELARGLRDPREVIRALRGLWSLKLARAELGAARKLAAELLASAKTVRDPESLGYAHAALGETLFHTGKLKAAQPHFERSLALGRRHPAEARTTHLPQVASYVAWGFWLAGYPDKARRRCSQAVEEARSLAHPHNRAFTLGCAAIVHELCGDVPRVAELVDEQLGVCREHGLPYWQSWAELLRGWILARQGHATQGVLTMRRALDAHRATGAVIGVTYFQILLAEVLSDAEQIEPGFQAAEEAMALAVRTGNRYVEPEIYRVRGELLLRVNGPGRPDAELSFRRAIATARRRSVRSFELRAATSLARLWQARGDRARAHRLLAPLCRRFTEGADTGDVIAARRVLAELWSSSRSQSRYSTT